MSNRPYTIKLFMPDGNPNSIKIIEKMNWTGVGIEMSRDDWETHKERKEFKQAGVYNALDAGIFQESNDIAVRTASIEGIKNGKNRKFPPQSRAIATDHVSYFIDADSYQILGEVLAQNPKI